MPKIPFASHGWKCIFPAQEFWSIISPARSCSYLIYLWGFCAKSMLLPFYFCPSQFISYTLAHYPFPLPFPFSIWLSCNLPGKLLLKLLFYQFCAFSLRFLVNILFLPIASLIASRQSHPHSHFPVPRETTKACQDFFPFSRSFPFYFPRGPSRGADPQSIHSPVARRRGEKLFAAKIRPENCFFRRPPAHRSHLAQFEPTKAII